MKFHLSVILFFSSFFSLAQKEFTFQECIDLALKNEKISISQQSNFKRATINQQFGKWSFLPSLSANSGYNINYGRKLDPFTNTFGVNAVNSNSYGLSTQLILFQGFRYFKQNQLFERNTNYSKLDIERAIEKIKNQVTEKCVLIWKIQLKIEQQTKIINDIGTFKQRQIELVKEGRLSSVDTLVTSINYKLQKISLMNFKRELTYETINLNFLVGLPLMNDTKLESFELSLSEIQLTLDEYFQVEDLKNKLEITELQYKIQKTQFIPSVSLYGNLGSGYSTNNKDYSTLNTPIIPYSQQINQNAYQGVGISLNIPIFNKGEWFKSQKMYEITKNENVELIAFKNLEIEKKKLELKSQKQYLQDVLTIQKGISDDKETIFRIKQMIYLEGKIRLDEVEKVEAEYYNNIQTIQDLEIELLKINMVKLD